MILFCQACNENHEFDTLDTEQLIYALQAELAETLVEDHNGHMKDYYDTFKNTDVYKAIKCLKQHDVEAHDSEAYGEHTSNLVDARRRVQGIGRCDNCGRDTPANADDCEVCKEPTP